MKTKLRNLYRIKCNEKTVGELSEVLIGTPSRVVGHAIIQNEDQENAKFFSDYDDAVTTFCNVYNVERDEVTRASWYAGVLSFPVSSCDEVQSFYDYLEGLGFEIEHTGGGCTWWAKYYLDGHYIAITQDGNKDIYEENLEELGVSVGLYWGEDSEGEFFMSHTIEGARGLVDVINTLKESKMYDIVSRQGFDVTLKGE